MNLNKKICCKCKEGDKKHYLTGFKSTKDGRLYYNICFECFFVKKRYVKKQNTHQDVSDHLVNLF
jgi:hypothetical protein